MSKALKIFLAVILAFLYVPIILLVIGSFNTGTDLAVIKGFTLSNYVELFRDKTLIPLLLNSIIVAVLSSVIATVLGTAAALGIKNFGRRSRSAILTITNIPMTNPDIVTGVSLSLLFVFIGSIFKQKEVLGFVTLLLAHITFNLPYVILSVMPRVNDMDPSLREAAMDLGCTPSQVFMKVTLPLSVSGIISGVSMVFVPAVSTFYISKKLGGSGTTLIGDVIESQFKTAYNPNLGAAISLLLMAMVFICIGLMERFTDPEDRGSWM